MLRRASPSLGDIDLFEIDEAFAGVVPARQQETGADLDEAHVHGGARNGSQTMCEAGGRANAMTLEAS